MRPFLFILFCFPFVLLSQNKRIVFVEGGTSINQSFYPKENVSGKLYTDCGWCWTGCNPQEIGNYHTTIKRATTFSFYSKIGIETPIVQKKHFSFSIPFIFGFREQRRLCTAEIERVYYSSSAYKYSTTTEDYSRFFSFIFGPKVTMDFKKWGFFTSINCNTDLFGFGRTANITSSDFGTTKTVSEGEGNYTSEDVAFNISLQNGILYNINSKISIGLSCDVFFYNFNPDVIKYSKKDNHFFNLGYGTNSTIINTGIRLQYSF